MAGLPDTAKAILMYCKSRRIFAIYGNMGAGKTTLIKAFCKALGSKDHFSSPTFSIVNEYNGADLIYHMDLYRLNTIREAIEAGLDHYLNSGNYCFIEWPELAEPILPPETVHLKIAQGKDGSRNITIHS